MANGNNPPTRSKGKGGNFEVRPNPFGNLRVVRRAPNVASVALFASVVDAVLQSGDALMLGHTRDGGALVLTLLVGEDRLRTYCSSDDELEEAINALHERYKVD